ncbi:MAG: hypothetical protein KDB01_24370 [Planctomycetaceae bacterium]|nr:hypothetical protein [Planctomycetaceae bacterium]
MTDGLSEKSRELRRHLLSHNGPDVAKSMAESGYEDPVGLIIEMTDEVGKQLTYAALERQGMPRHEIPELIASYCRNAVQDSCKYRFVYVDQAGFEQYRPKSFGELLQGFRTFQD